MREHCKTKHKACGKGAVGSSSQLRLKQILQLQHKPYLCCLHEAHDLSSQKFAMWFEQGSCIWCSYFKPICWPQRAGKCTSPAVHYRTPICSHNVCLLFLYQLLSSLPKSVKRRVNALKNLQVNSTHIEAKFYKEVHELERKYSALYQPLFDKVSLLVRACVCACMCVYTFKNIYISQ